MKIYQRSYKFEAGQKCSDYNRDNLADVEVVLYDFCVYLRVMRQLKATQQQR